MSRKRSAKNFYQTKTDIKYPTIEHTTKDKSDLRVFVSNISAPRESQNVETWRSAIKSAERAFIPNRVQMQTIFKDTWLNAHVRACWEKRRNLTAQKDFKIFDSKGNELEEWTKFFKQRVFNDMTIYIIDAIAFGYSFINWFDIKDNKIGKLQIIKRENIDPDQETICYYSQAFSGISIHSEEIADWSLFVTTPSDNGVSRCGYGLFYTIALNEIYLKILMGQNSANLEMFGSPYVLGKTSKINAEERLEFMNMLKNFSAGKYGMIDDISGEQIDLIESKNVGDSARPYESSQERHERSISKVLLGHASAIDMVSGKLGSSDEVKEALALIEKSDQPFVEDIYTNNVFPKLRNIGFNIPEDAEFKFLNDKEKFEEDKKKVEYNTQIATIVKTLKDSGKSVDPKWIEEMTGIPVVDAPTTDVKTPPISKKVQNKLNELYK